MGYFCTVCNSVTDAVTVNSIIHHFHYRHGISAMQKCRITCGQQECSRTFDGVHALRMHLKRHHPVDPYVSQKLPVFGEFDNDVSAVACDTADDSCSVENWPETNADFDDTISEKLTIDNIQDMFLDFMIALKSKIIAQSTIDFVSQGLVTVILAVLKVCQDPLRTKNYGECESCISELEAMCNELSKRHSNYSLKKYLRDCKGLVEPAELTLGNRTEVRKTVTNDHQLFMCQKQCNTSRYWALCKNCLRTWKI